MAIERIDPRRAGERYFESEPADEWQEAYGRGGPVRSDEPERDYFFENSAAPTKPSNAEERRQLRRMTWRAEGAQDYPGGELEGQLAVSYSGKGPKSYRPSDERLRERVCERLTDDPFVDATDIDVEVVNCEVTMSGTVDTRRMKYAAEDLVSEIAGVSAVRNSIQVRRAM